MTTTPTQPTNEQSADLTLNSEQILFPKLPYNIKPRANAATKNEQLQAFVEKATYLKDISRKKMCLDTFGENYDAMRTLAGNIKQHTLDNLDYYIEQFVKNAEAAGAQVHFAKDGKQANEIALAIAQENNCKKCVKSKSMVTEETHLLPVLENEGIEVVETDLGEFILQLDKDAPSHIVTPMIHKDRTAVARAFQRELGADYTEDPAELTQIARNYLRQKYREADLGISGGNFLVADTGAVVICTNEGNGRFSTSVPPVHIAFVGIEKLVPTREHAAVLMKMLARSSTGQPLTVYLHMMTGPKRPIEPDGPEQMHIILLDNGRTEILRKKTREMLRCIRCGACLNACPVYRKIGGHAYGSVYPGPIGSLLTPMFKGLHNYKDLPNASSLCGACFEACPVKINIPKYLIQHRVDMLNRHYTSLVDRLGFKMYGMTIKNSKLFNLSNWGQRLFFRTQAKLLGKLDKGDPYSAKGWVKSIPGPASGWTKKRDLVTPTQKNFRQWWNEREKK